MTLPSLGDVVIVIVLLVPGFFAFTIIRKMGIVLQNTSELETIIYSVFLTIIILIPFTALTGFTNFDTIRDEFFKSYNFGIIFVSTLGVGFGTGFILKKLKRNFLLGDPWEIIMKRYIKLTWVVVITRTGQEYMGKFRAAGIATDRRELIMSKPVQIFRDEKGNFIQEMEIGKEVIFTEEDISRVFFLSDWNEQNNKK